MMQTEATKALTNLFYYACNYKVDKNHRMGNAKEYKDIVSKDLKELAVYKLAYEWKCNGVEGTYEELLDKARNTVEGWYRIDEQGYGEVIE